MQSRLMLVTVEWWCMSCLCVVKDDKSKDASLNMSYVLCESKKSPLRFSDIFFRNSWEFVINILYTFYVFLSALDDKFLFNYLQLWQSYAILSESTRRIFYISLELTVTCKFAYWANGVTVDVMSYPTCLLTLLKAADLGWLATDNDQQSYQRLSQTSELVHFSRWWTFWAYYLN